MKDAYTTRLATPDDAPTLSAMATRTYINLVSTVHAGEVSDEDLAAHIAASYSVEKIRQEIEDPMRATVFVFPADDPETPCGFVMLWDGSIRPGDEAIGKAEDYLEVKRVYVEAAFHGKGASYVMMERAMEIIKQKKRRIVWLNTGHRNARAQKFYRKHGFEITGKKHFKVGQKAHVDAVLTLQPPKEELTEKVSVDDRLTNAVSA